MSQLRRTLVVGTRGSRLSLRQTQEVVDLLQRLHPHLTIEVSQIRTEGDRDQTSSLTVIGGKGVFVKDIERALLDGKIDLAVHSLKDVPSGIPDGLTLAAITERADARDAFVSRDGLPLSRMAAGARIGTSSGRRAAQVRALRPDLTPVDIRGNVDTRLRKLDEGQVDGIMLAVAGLARLGLLDRATEVLEPDVMLPAVGQGALALETRADDAHTISLVIPLDHQPSRLAVTAERSFLRRLGGGCRLPMGCYGILHDGYLRLQGMIADMQGTQIFRGVEEGLAGEAEAIGIRLADRLLHIGAAELIASQEK